MKSRNVKRNLSILLSLSLMVSIAQGNVIAKLPEEQEKRFLEFCDDKDDDKNRDSDFKNSKDRVYNKIKRLC
jgi:hypothetical protein